MRRALILIALFGSSSAGEIGLPPPLAPAAADPAWREMKRLDGVVARLASSGGRTPWGSAEGHIDAPPEAVLEHLLSFEKMPRMVPRLSEVRVLARGDADALVYFYFDLPWPISDRDYTARYRWERLPDGRIRFLSEDASERGPPPGKAIRVAQIRTAWDLVPDGAGTAARYVALVDFGGSLPRGVVDQTAWKQPLQTLLGIRKSFLPHGER